MGVSDGKWPGIPQDEIRSAARPICPGSIPTERFCSSHRRWRRTKASGSNSNAPQPAPAAEAYMLAVADPASYGARWVVSLDDALRADLTAKKQPALDTWKKITTMLAFFEQHKQARTYQPMGALAVMSDFGGPDWFPGEEALNLLPRLREPSRVIARSRAAGASYDGLQAIFYVDREPPEAHCGRN